MQAGVICDREKDLYGVSPRASLRHGSPQDIAYLRHDDELLARQVKLLDGLSQYHFRKTVRINLSKFRVNDSEVTVELGTHVRSVESLDSGIIARIEWFP